MAQIIPKPRRQSESKSVGDRADLVEVTRVELDDLDGNNDGDDSVDDTRRPLREGFELACAFLLILGMKPPERFVEFAADFAAGVKIAEKIRKFTARADEFGGRVPLRKGGLPTRDRATQGG